MRSLDQTLMLDLERARFDPHSFRGNPPVPWLKSGGRRQAEAIDTSGRVGVAILNPVRISLPHLTPISRATTIHPYRQVPSWMSAGSDPDSNRRKSRFAIPPNHTELVTDRSGIERKQGMRHFKSRCRHEPFLCTFHIVSQHLARTLVRNDNRSIDPDPRKTVSSPGAPVVLVPTRRRRT